MENLERLLFDLHGSLETQTGSLVDPTEIVNQIEAIVLSEAVSFADNEYCLSLLFTSETPPCLVTRIGK